MDKNVGINLVLSQEENEIIDLVHQICKEQVVPARKEMDEKEIFPSEILKKFKEADFFGILFDSEYGGLGMGSLMAAIVVEAVSQYCLGVATVFCANKLGVLPIEVGGTKEQKEKYIPAIVSGDKLAAFALSEPDAGSDVPHLSTIAEKKGDRYIINGTKQWISNGGMADIYTVFALTNKSRGSRGISVFILEKGSKGLSFGKLEDKLGIRCSHTRQVILEDCEVPEENLIGLVPNHGFIHAIKTLNASRPFIASMATGLSQGAYLEAAKYAYQREQFGKKVINFQAINHMLADMVVKIHASRMLAYKSAKFSEIKHPESAKFSAMAKYYSSEIALQVVNDALQIHGGYGFTKDYPIEKMYRDAKILTIYEGTSQIQKNEIASYIIQEAAKL